MIDLSQSTVAYLLLSSVLLGISHGVLYDVVRFVKLMLGVNYEKGHEEPRSRVYSIFLHVVTFILDVIFWMSFAVSSVLLTYNISGGVFRGIVYLGMLVGGGSYYLTLGRLVLRISKRLTRLVKKALKWIIGVVLMPVRAIISLIIKLYHLTIGKVIGKIIGVVREQQKKRRASAKNTDDADLIEYSKEESDRNATKFRYKSEGRISFAGRRDER